MAWKGLWSAWVFFDMRALWDGGELCEQEEYGIEGPYKVSHGVSPQY